MPGIRLLLVALLLPACAHRPVDLAGCALPMTRIAVAEPAAGAAITEAPVAVDPFAAMVAGAMAPGAGLESTAAPARPVALFMSGGGQNGAFGASFVDEWRIGNGGRLPEFRVVTGVSTGALIGSFVFTGASDRAVRGYTIAAESDLLDVKARGLLAQVKAGAVGDLTPLRRRIDTLFDTAPGDDALLGDIAAAGADGRKLFVGVVDVRDGEAWAIDLTALAQRWQVAAPAARPAIKACYIEAMIASSSAPFAAPPVYVDGRMLVDGGARFGIFRAAEQAGLALAADARPISFLIVNGTLAIDPQCAFEAVDGACPASGRLKSWNILDLGFRSVDILTNQVYRFSAAEAAAGAGDHAFVRIEADAPAHLFDGRTCRDWRSVDDGGKPPPVQFHPRQMACLIDYGRARARTEQWWLKD